MPSSDARRNLLGDSASESGDFSVRSGLSAASPSSCGGGAGCSGCEPRLAIRVAAIGEGDEGEDDEDDDDLDDKSSRRASGSGIQQQQQRRRQRVQGRAVLHAGGGFSFRQDREGGGGKVSKQRVFSFCLAFFLLPHFPFFLQIPRVLLLLQASQPLSRPPRK